MTSRRVVLGVAAGLAAAGCAPSDPAPAPASDPTPPASAPVPTPSVSPPQPSPTPSPSPTPAGPTRADIVAQFGGLTPTTWGLEMDGIVSRTDADAVVLTLDACGGPRGSGIDERILGALRERGIPATLFLNTRWIDANPGAAEDFAAEGFELANHGTRHVPLSVTGRDAYGIVGTADAGDAFDEVMGNHARLTEILGREPRFFRSGTAHYDDVAVRIVGALGEVVAGFSVNADAGATFSAKQVAAELGRSRPGDIVIGHFNQPNLDAGAGYAKGLTRCSTGAPASPPSGLTGLRAPARPTD